ncbi:MAG: FtsX-like permease family protein [Acidimicrobiaceae bacterium]|nr:FtsX-like permease family protein [Acidimicrobiaceae bacterium]MYC40959.1 FtsX-like permease family protein [Acidimicrobiaceae bacterium]
MIFKLIRRNISGKPFRFLLTCSAVTLGVMFTVGVFVFTDSLRATFGNIAEDIDGDTEFAVRAEVEFGERELVGTPVGDDVVDLLQNIDGVAGVQPQILKFGSVPIDGDGEAQTANPAPNLGVNWPDQSSVPGLFIQQGRPPQGPGEFALDSDAFAEGNFAIGETYSVINPAGPGEFDLVGTFFFASPDENALVGAKLVAYETTTAREVINLGTGYDQITFETRASADSAAVGAAVAAALPDGIELVTGEQLVEEQTADFEEFIGFFQTFLLVFAFIILAVSAFVIFNVFTILIGQRIRELGLLRAIGASGNQVTAALLGDALLVGLFATVVGTGLGIGFGWSLRWLLARLDFGPGGNELLLEPATFIWGVGVGIGVSMASAVAPALRARRISPMAALREDARLSRHVPEANLIIGGIVTMVSWIVVVFAIAANDWLPILGLGSLAAIGNAFGIRRLVPRLGRYGTLGFGLAMMLAALVLQLEIVSVLALVGLAALTIFLGVNSISPMLARPLSNIIGRWPLAILLGITGVVTAAAGGLATLGVLFLLITSVIDLISGFDGAALARLLGALALIPVTLSIVLVGVRGVDAAFIMGWKLRWVVAGVGLFLFGAAGAVLLLTGLVAILTAEWGSVVLMPVGVVILGLVVFLRGWLPKTLKSNARMARENAGRNPRRSASAAAALMIGLALVSTAAVVASSFKATFADVLEESVTSDWFVSPSSGGGPDSQFSPALADDLERLTEAESVVRYRFAFEAYRTVFDDVVRDSSAADLAASLDHLDPDFVALDESLFGRNSIWVHEDMATDNDFVLGSAFDIEFPDGTVETVTVAGIFTDSSIYGNRVISLELWADRFPSSQDQFISVNIRDGVSEEQARAALQSYTDDYPTLNVETRDEFQDRQAGQVDSALTVINVLVGVSVLIALLGISITLALSVFERTRELGLVRAVGMTTRQMLRMVLFEGAIIAVFGGVLGILLGTAFGSVAVSVMPDDFISALDVPVNDLLTYLVVAAIAGIAAAIVPARRAARLNVLDAIAQG